MGNTRVHWCEGWAFCLASFFSTFKIELKYYLLKKVFATFLKEQGTVISVSMTLEKILELKSIKSIKSFELALNLYLVVTLSQDLSLMEKNVGKPIKYNDSLF